jgi:P4 family phage/plasmid primase-like protien
VLLPYRAASEGWGKACSAWFDDELGAAHRVEVLGKGQQFVAYHVHPDTNAPYEWVDLLGGIEFVRADDLPVLTESQVAEALRTFERMAEEAGLLKRVNTSVASDTPRAPKERTPAEDEDFFGRVNETALQSLGSWVPALFPSAREYGDGYRVSSIDLQRDLEEDLSIVPDGIVDFGIADMGDARQGKRTPIDLVLEWAPVQFDDPFDAPIKPFEAALWLCDQLDTKKEELGFGLRRQREKQAERQAKRMSFDALSDKVSACDDSIVLLDEVAKIARDVLADTPALHTEVAALLKARYKELTGLTLQAADLSKALREHKPPTVKARRPLTEFGNAERMLDKYGNGLMFVPQLGSWFVWTGVYWRFAPDIELEHLAKETVKALANEVADHPEPAEFFKFCAISQQAKMVRNMVALAQSDPRVYVPADELDKHSHYMGATNGVIDLRTGELLPPDPELRITCTTGCDYDPEAAAPLWEQTVSDVFCGDKDMIEFFQRLVGYSAMGNPTQDVMVIPFGNGSNGKSTLLGTVRKALGSYAKAAEASSFVSEGKGGSGAGGAREDLVRLKGARFVYVNEPDENSELREGAVKSMTGGDAITARGLYNKNTVEIMPTWVVFMPTNHKPIIKGSDHGIWRRIMLLPFTRSFDSDPTVKKDPNREEKLHAELPGILAWIVRGAMAYQRAGLAPVGTVLKARDDYREDMDLLAEWLNECCEFAPYHLETTANLWSSWEQFAKSRGLLLYVKNSVQLGRRLDARFPTHKGTGGVRMRKGLHIRNDFDGVADLV